MKLISVAKRLLKALDPYTYKSRREQNMKAAMKELYRSVVDQQRELARMTHNYTSGFNTPDVFQAMNGIIATFNQMDFIRTYFARKGKMPKTVKTWHEKAEAIKRRMSEAFADYRFSGPSY